MNILLTGSNGFLGSIIRKKLNKFHNIYTLSRSNSDFNFDLKDNIPTYNTNFKLIIHCAGLAHYTSKKLSDANIFYDINVNGTKNLLTSLNRNILPKYFVFISSVSVYGLIIGENINENQSLNAKDPYGQSKIQAEFLVKKWCEENNVICTILRLPLIVGPNPPGNLGSMIKGIKKGFYFNISDGNANKSMVLATDIAKFIIKAAEVGGTYNLTDGNHPTFSELSRCISQLFGKSYVPNMPLFLAKVLAKLGDIIGDDFPINSNKLFKIISTLTFDDSKAISAFGWKPTPVIEELKLIKNV